MVKKISPEILRMKIGVSRREPHIRWNWERAEGLGMDGPERDNSLVRYHFVVLDDRRYRNRIMNMLANDLRDRGGAEEIRRIEETVKGSGYKYLFCSFDSPAGPGVLDWNPIKIPVIQDKNLYERVRKGAPGIEEYVANLYGG